MQKNPSVLGLSIGTRKMGIAVVKNNHLDCARVWVFPGIWDDTKLHKMMRKINKKVHKFGIKHISVKVPSLSHHTVGLKAVIAAIKEYCKEKNILLHICTIKELKTYNSTEQRKNKKELVQTLGNKYPQLYFTAKKEAANRNTHHTKMFEAVAAAELFLKQLQKNI